MADALKEPLFRNHLINLLLAIVLIGCSANAHAEIYDSEVCAFNADYDACSYVWGLGAWAAFVSLAFIIFELRKDFLKISGRAIYILEILLAAMTSLLMFIAVCWMANAWSKTSSDLKHKAGPGNAGTAIATALLGTVSWATIICFSVRSNRSSGNEGLLG